MLIDLTEIEVHSLVKVLGEITISFDEPAMTGMKKIFSSVNEDSSDIVKCNCGVYFNKSGDPCCPDCSEDYADMINIGNRVYLPNPDFEQGQTWAEGAAGTVEDFQEINFEKHAIVVTDDGRRWVIDIDNLEKI